MRSDVNQPGHAPLPLSYAPRHPRSHEFWLALRRIVVAALQVAAFVCLTALVLAALAALQTACAYR
jgi:hypothetical protein